MLRLQKLTRNGNATTVSIKRAWLEFLHWHSGQTVVLTLTEENTIVIRAPRPEDFAPAGMHPIELSTERAAIK